MRCFICDREMIVAFVQPERTLQNCTRNEVCQFCGQYGWSQGTINNQYEWIDGFTYMQRRNEPWQPYCIAAPLNETPLHFKSLAHFFHDTVDLRLTPNYPLLRQLDTMHNRHLTDFYL